MGMERKTRTTNNGARIITQSSISCGSRANRAKYHNRYQSGLGWAFIKEGSGGFSIAGGPNQRASTIMPTTTSVLKTMSRQAASGQNALPSRLSIVLYFLRYVLGSTNSPGMGGSEIPL